MEKYSSSIKLGLIFKRGLSEGWISELICYGKSKIVGSKNVSYV